MINSIKNYFRPANTASVLSQITSMIDRLDDVNAKHTALAIKHDAIAKAYTDKSITASKEAATASTAARKIKAAFGV